MGVSNLGTLIRASIPDKKENERTISYSQFSMWSTCPLHWKLRYIDKHKLGKPSIATVFGTSFHETMQWYLKVMYNETIKKSSEINLAEMLQEQMMNNYAVAVIENNDEHFSTSTELQEYYTDGVEILEWIRKKRAVYFSSKEVELVGIELPLYVQATDSNPNVIMTGFLDVVLYDRKADKITILDIKTSNSGWNKYAKADKLKASQLVLYKSYLSKQFGLDEDKIDIQYFIVKRKLIEGFAYPQKRVQQFVPASGKPTRNKLIKEVDNFVTSCFNPDGSYKVDVEYPAIANKGKSCKYCEFSNRYDLCPKEKRV